MTRILTATLVAAIATGQPGDLSAQGGAVMPIEACEERCGRITLTKVRELGGETRDPVLMHWRGVPTRLGGGGWITSETFERGVVAFYDSTGGYLRSIGREGGGPGEFRSTRDVQGPLGFVWIIDSGNQRVTVLGPAGQIVGAFRFSGFIGYTAPVDSERVAVLGTLFSDRDGMSTERIHILNNEGTILRSFGDPADEPVVLDARRIFLTPHGTLVATHQESYAIQEWTLGGELLRVLGREVEWFERDPGNRFAPHGPALLSSAVDSEGRMWVVLKRPGKPFRGRRMPRGFAARMELSGGVRIEIIDLDDARVIATQEVDLPYLFPVLPFEGQFVSPAEDGAGYIHFDLWEGNVSS